MSATDSTGILLPWLNALTIAHHVPGRIRLNLSGTLPAAPQGAERALSILKERVPAITDLRVNLLARSCTVAYDTNAIIPRWWEQLILERDPELLQKLTHQIEIYKEL